jgi:hypothetical protein
MPFVDWDLAGEDGRAAAVAVLEDLLEIVAGAGVERFQGPIIEDQQLDTGEAAQDASIASVAARQGEIGEQLGHATIEHRAVVAAGLMAESAGQPAFADTGPARTRSDCRALRSIGRRRAFGTGRGRDHAVRDSRRPR